MNIQALEDSERRVARMTRGIRRERRMVQLSIYWHNRLFLLWRNFWRPVVLVWLKAAGAAFFAFLGLYAAICLMQLL